MTKQKSLFFSNIGEFLQILWDCGLKWVYFICLAQSLDTDLYAEFIIKHLVKLLPGHLCDVIFTTAKLGSFGKLHLQSPLPEAGHQVLPTFLDAQPESWWKFGSFRSPLASLPCMGQVLGQPMCTPRVAPSPSVSAVQYRLDPHPS